MIRVAVIGYGRWGPNLARCIAANPAFALVSICDRSTERLAVAAEDYRAIDLGREVDRVIADPGVNAVVVATPALTHAGIAHAALRAGKHVLVEKPIALSAQDVLQLIEDADRRRLVLMIDHTYLFSPPVRAIGAAIQSGALGTIRSMRSVRVNAGVGPSDVNVLWDLAYHDLSIVDSLFGSDARNVSAIGYAAESGALEHRAELSLQLSSGVDVNVQVDWSGPAKVRQLAIVGSENTLAFDDLQPQAKVKIYPSHTGSSQAHGNGTALPFVPGEPLQAVADHFAACILAGARPLSDGAAGLRIVRLLEAAARSIADASRPIALATDGVA